MTREPRSHQWYKVPARRVPSGVATHETADVDSRIRDDLSGRPEGGLKQWKAGKVF